MVEKDSMMVRLNLKDKVRYVVITQKLSEAGNTALLTKHKGLTRIGIHRRWRRENIVNLLLPNEKNRYTALAA